MKIVAFVPIKLKSQRLDNKNILPLGNYPLLWYIFNTLKKIKLIDEIYVFCSDSKIINYIPDGIKYLQRDTRLDLNETKGIDIYTDFANLIDADIYVLAHATSPFIECSSIQTGIEKIIYDKYDSAFSVQKIQTFGWYMSQPINYNLDNVVRTQDLEPIYIETSAFYIFRKHILLDHKRRIGYNPFQVITNHIESIDIDEMDDYQLAQSIILSNKHLNIPHNNTHPKFQLKSKIKMVIMDFDGTLSNGHIYLNNNFPDSYTKHYNVKDGYIINKLSEEGIRFAIVSGNNLDFFQSIAHKLNISSNHMCGNCYDKVKVVNYLCDLNDLKINEEVAYIGDDDNDIEIMKQVGIAGCPSNASTNAKLNCQFISKYKGGDGAVREFLEYIFE